MRHRKRSRRLVGKWEHRQALMRNLLAALFTHERIRTTEAKAKELRRLADKMITLAKRGDLAARRRALSILPNKVVVRKLFGDLRERYLDRESGFTRIVRLGPRRGDAAMMVFVELVTDRLEHRRSPQKAKREAAAAAVMPQATEDREEQVVAEAESAAPVEEMETQGEQEAPAPESSSPEAQVEASAAESEEAGGAPETEARQEGSGGETEEERKEKE